MIHFAYPTAKGDVFLACGRFIASAEYLPDYEIAAPNISNRSEVNVATSELAPESSEIRKLIYEIKDESPQKFMGDSMDFAYMLALISRSRSLKFSEEMNGDIWCTGTIDIKNNKYPFLRTVNPTGFDGKLKGFVSGDNPDMLFIVPASNIENHHQALLQQHEAELLTLTRSQKIDFQKKTVLKVRENDLEILRDFLFQKPLSEKFSLKKIGFILIAVLLMIGSGYYYFNDAFSGKKSLTLAETIVACLENGEFTKAVNLVKKASSDDAEVMKLKEILEKPIILEVKFQYHIAGQPPYTSMLYSLDSQELRQLILSHKDYYRFQIISYLNNISFYLYVFQEDSFGNVERLFPNPPWIGKEDNNPIDFSDYTCYIPPNKKKWIYLDRLPDPEKEAEEILYIIASPWRAEDIENLYGEIHKETSNEKRERQIRRFIGQMKLRQHAGLPSVFYKEFSFKHGLVGKAVEK